MKSFEKVVQIITLISTIIIWGAVIVGIRREESIFDDTFLVFLLCLAISMTLLTIVGFFNKKSVK